MNMMCYVQIVCERNKWKSIEINFAIVFAFNHLCFGTLETCPKCFSQSCNLHRAHNHKEISTGYRSSSSSASGFKKCEKCSLPALGTSGRCSGHGYRGRMFNSQGSLTYDGR